MSRDSELGKDAVVADSGEKQWAKLLGKAYEFSYD